MNKAVDGGECWITVDTLAFRLIGRVRLRSPSSTIYVPEDVEIPPQPAGTLETTDPIAGLPARTLYFAIKARDEVPGQFSGISNVLTVFNP